MYFRRRNTLRLPGYDYTRPGRYLVTVKTRSGESIFGHVQGGRMTLSAVGNIVNTCWENAPKHFQDFRKGVFQIMPNHLHGIVHILAECTVCVENVIPVGTPGDTAMKQSDPRRNRRDGRALPAAGSLSAYVRSFKSAVTKEIHERDLVDGHVRQYSFYDRVIRNNREYFFTEQYIELNPIMWDLDSDNPEANTITLEIFEPSLRTIMKVHIRC